MKLRNLTLAVATSAACVLASAQTSPVVAPAAPTTPVSVAGKLVVRGDMNGLVVPEIRATRKNDILSVQTDVLNTGRKDVYVFYRYRWLDATGNQVGDGESWKQLLLLGLAQQTVKSVAPVSTASDFRLEMNIESK